MPELIDREALLQDMTARFDGIADWHYFDCVNEQPTIEAEPIVRCGECRYMEPNGHCTQFADDHIRPSVSDFCSAGARIDGGAENA